jgi:mRNA interferase HigB
MRVLSLRALRDFWEKERRSEDVLRDFYSKLTRIEPRNLSELKKVFPAVDLVGSCYVFNVGGNKYRVITRIHFNRQMVFIRHVLTHSDYDRDKWKAEC